MKVVDTREYVTMLRGLVEEGREVSMVIAGSSMSPFLIHKRDVIYFRSPDRPFRTGDMVFYLRDNGRYVMHRICRVRPEGYYLVGDAQTAVEGPIRPDQIFARITKVRRKERWLAEGCFWWEFFARIWIRVIPLRPAILGLYSFLRRKKTEKR